jgi:hypothetical protein
MPQKFSIKIHFQVMYFEYDNGVTLLDAET